MITLCDLEKIYNDCFSNIYFYEFPGQREICQALDIDEWTQPTPENAVLSMIYYYQPLFKFSIDPENAETVHAYFQSFKPEFEKALVNICTKAANAAGVPLELKAKALTAALKNLKVELPSDAALELIQRLEAEK